MRRGFSTILNGVNDLSTIMTQRFIINKDLPTCNKCEFYYISKKSKLPGYCTKFGEKNIITGAIKYVYAQEIRADEDLCGKRGLYYSEKISNN